MADPEVFADQKIHRIELWNSTRREPGEQEIITITQKNMYTLKRKVQNIEGEPYTIVGMIINNSVKFKYYYSTWVTKTRKRCDSQCLPLFGISITSTFKTDQPFHQIHSEFEVI